MMKVLYWTKDLKNAMYLIYLDKYENIVVGIASTLEKAVQMAETLNQQNKDFESEVDLIEQKDLWIEVFPVNELIEP